MGGDCHDRSSVSGDLTRAKNVSVWMSDMLASTDRLLRVLRHAATSTSFGVLARHARVRGSGCSSGYCRPRRRYPHTHISTEAHCVQLSRPSSDSRVFSPSCHYDTRYTSRPPIASDLNECVCDLVIMRWGEMGVSGGRSPQKAERWTGSTMEVRLSER